ncbi:hypothetical protein [Calothrix sp. CCY 0018]|uniref:hypothetical protein n=1 Tax=Calothrix sp. CCY 0018 TaxID=3103864 RepID=UPI0039C6ED29
MHIQKIIVGLLTLSLSCISNSPVLATEVSSKEKCISETKEVAQKLIENRNVKLRFDVRDISKYEEDYPYNRPLAFDFAFEGQATGDIMNSPQFLKIATTRIIRNCSNVAQVNFGQYQTDWSITVGLMHDGNIRRFKCFDPSELTVSSKLKWGETICL